VQNRLSEVQAFTFITLRGQYGLWFDHAMYGNQDKWFFLGRLRYQRFPLLYFGIGPDTDGNDPAVVDASLVLVRERVLHKITNNFFGGFEFDYQNLHRVEFEQPDANPYDLPQGSAGSANLGLGAGLVYDNRHNVLNVRRGFFSELAYLNYNKRWGSAFDFHFVTFDSRLYRPLGKQVLALQLSGNFTTGDVPFNQLALIGGETIMRGYYLGRYRDRSYLATQAEYRWLPFPFSRRFGGVVFAAVGSVAPTPLGFRLRNLLPSGGVGVRYLLFAKKDIFLRFDVGATPEGFGFYIFTGEAF
jgi:outer membrane protein assembly factor BamA